MNLDEEDDDESKDGDWKSSSSLDDLFKSSSFHEKGKKNEKYIFLHTGRDYFHGQSTEGLNFLTDFEKWELFDFINKPEESSTTLSKE